MHASDNRSADVLMIPVIASTSLTQSLYLNFIETLAHQGFTGEVTPDYASRTVLATDNSIYQVLPQAVIYPASLDDLVLVAALAENPPFHAIVLSARGGGTGTNGQSLTDGIVVDLSRHLNKILEINAEERWVRVQAGVVKDQLNAAIKPYGLFFAPELSTSNRATIGGMINTDASGQGSCRYGKTRDHVIELTTVLLGGSVLKSEALSEEGFRVAADTQNRSGLAHRVVNSIWQEHKTLIDERFPKLNRCLTGYDLAHIRESDGRFNLNNILCGSEGTLGFIYEAKINLLPIPAFSALVIVNYASFDSSLRDAPRLMQAGPTSIETLDSRVLELARQDNSWHEVSGYFPSDNLQDIRGMNLVEYTADSKEALAQALGQLVTVLKSTDAATGIVGHGIAMGDDAVNKIWAMRKKAVGLLGNTQGEARPIPFVEDTAVPPEHLADYIAEFRAILDAHHLSYGMFGHVDAGVLHVRPAIDMKDPDALKMVRTITDHVSALTHKYHGLLWGEHGKGVRSEYAPTFFGPLYPQLQRIKAVFDPRNQLNPGKIATPTGVGELLKIDAVPTRGEQDRQIAPELWQGFKEAVYCNGNGACFNWNTADAMCPSYKATRNRVHSPKGRASLVREWIRLLGQNGFDTQQFTAAYPKLPKAANWLTRVRNSRSRDYDFSHEVKSAMNQCLACKSCVGQCPIKVDVPEFRSKFLALYHTRYARPLKDYLVANLERFVPYLAPLARVINPIQRLGLVRQLLAKGAGFVDSPSLSTVNFKRRCGALGIYEASPERLAALDAASRAKSLIIVQDAFTRFFEAEVLLDVLECLKKLGFTPWLAPFMPNGKPLHVQGFLREFHQTATATAERLSTLAASGVPLVGLEPATTLAFRAEYSKALGDKAPQVALLQEWLSGQLDHLSSYKDRFQSQPVKLLGHCTEKTTAPASQAQWQAVFKQLGLSLDQVNVGCCGMAGTFGHETANRQLSSQIFDLSWRKPLTQPAGSALWVATGYSCRSQALRETQISLMHPLQALLRLYRAPAVKPVSLSQGS